MQKLSLLVFLLIGIAFLGSAKPYVVLLPVVCLGYSVLITYATYVVWSETPGEPPLALGLLVTLLALAASVMLLMGGQREPGERGELAR